MGGCACADLSPGRVIAPRPNTKGTGVTGEAINILIGMRTQGTVNPKRPVRSRANLPMLHTHTMRNSRKKWNEIGRLERGSKGILRKRSYTGLGDLAPPRGGPDGVWGGLACGWSGLDPLWGSPCKALIYETFKPFFPNKNTGKRPRCVKLETLSHRTR